MKTRCFLEISFINESLKKIRENLSILASQAPDINTSRHIITINPEMLVFAQKNKNFSDVIRHPQKLCFCDGVGIMIWAWIKRRFRLQRIAGVDIAWILCDIANEFEYKVLLIGGEKNIAKKSQKHLLRYFPKLRCETLQEPDIKAIQLKKPHIVLLCLGSPKQELWIHQHLDQLSSVCLIGGFGGTFDFWSGHISRAPKWMRIIGLEWFWRLCRQPSRFGRIWRAVVSFSWLAFRRG